MSDACERCRRVFRRHECLQIADGKAYCQVACADDDQGERCEQCDALLHPNAHISDACQKCGHVEERAVQPVLVPYALPLSDDDIPY